jgi:hypothetical protein
MDMSKTTAKSFGSSPFDLGTTYSSQMPALNELINIVGLHGLTGYLVIACTVVLVDLDYDMMIALGLLLMQKLS